MSSEQLDKNTYIGIISTDEFLELCKEAGIK